MEQFDIPDFKEHLIEGLSGKIIKLYHFTATPYPAHEFRVTLSKWPKGIQILDHDKSLITARPTHNCQDGNLNWCLPAFIDPDSDLYIKIEKRHLNIEETELPMKLLYSIVNRN